jgi:hypothetical protein
MKKKFKNKFDVKNLNLEAIEINSRKAAEKLGLVKPKLPSISDIINNPRRFRKEGSYISR